RQLATGDRVARRDASQPRSIHTSALVTPITTYRTLPASHGIPTTSDVGSAMAASSQPAAPEVTHDSPEHSANRHTNPAASSATPGGTRAMNGPTDRSRRR